MTLGLKEIFLAIASDEVETLARFYAQLFSVSPNPHIPNSYANFQVAGMRIAIFKPISERATEFLQRVHPGPLSLCLEVESLEVAIAHWINQGNPAPSEVISASHGQEFYGLDPVGNRLIFHES
ncbi:MAG: VOC family protein [Cyanobacteria bacterium P01_H01_bin.15]